MGISQYLKSLGYEETVLMEAKIAEWWGWYTAVNDWYSSTEYSPTARRTYKVERQTIKPARMVCQEWASLLMNERTGVVCEDDVVNEWLTAHLEETRFFSRSQSLIERTFALGTGAWALRVAGIVDGARTSPDAKVIVQRYDARQIRPLSYDEDTCTECAFTSKVVIGGKPLDQLQIHRLLDGRYVVETAFFDKNGKLVDVPGIAPYLDTKKDVPAFALIRPNLENTHSDYSPMGVSVFDDAIGAVKLVDVAVDNTYKDIYLAQKMLFLDERMIETDAKGNSVVPRAADQQLFRKTEVDSGKLIEEYNPDMRIADNRLALTTGLELLGKRTGMGDDYFSIEQSGAMKTATEVISEQSLLFRNVRKHENLLSPAVSAIVAGIISLTREVRGVSLPDPGVITVRFDDSIIEDSDAERKRDLSDMAAGVMQPWEYRAKWYAEDEATARASLVGTEPPPPGASGF